MSNTDFAYEDIVCEQRPRSAKHPPMSVQKRAAQFAPFAALTGHKEAVAETARLTEEAIVPDESVAEEVNRALCCLAKRVPSSARVTWFEPDARKAGGRYVTATLAVKRVDTDRRELVLDDGKRLSLTAVIAVENDE